MNYYHDWWEKARNQNPLILTKPKERELLLKRIKKLEVEKEEIGLKLGQDKDKIKEKLEKALQKLIENEQDFLQTETNFTNQLTDLKAEKEQLELEKESLLTINQEITQEQQTLKEITQEASNKLDTLYQAIEADNLGKPKEAKKLILNYVKTIRNSLELESLLKRIKTSEPNIYKVELEKSKEKIKELVEQNNTFAKEKSHWNRDRLELERKLREVKEVEPKTTAKPTPPIPPKPTISKKLTTKETKWQHLHHQFTSQLIKEWENRGFDYQKTQEWASVWGTKFNPQDYDFIAYLKNTKGNQALDILNTGDEATLRTEYENWKANK